MSEPISHAQAVEAAKQARELIQQYARPDYYYFLLDPFGQQTDPTKRAKEAMALLDSILSAAVAERDGLKAEWDEREHELLVRAGQSCEESDRNARAQVRSGYGEESAGEESLCQEGGNHGLCKTHPTCELARKRIAALQAFKDWCHAYLDGKGIPHHPPGVHGAEGCRIGDRMDYVFERFTERASGDDGRDLSGFVLRTSIANHKAERADLESKLAAAVAERDAAVALLRELCG